ncbi:unnamed protein product, partial [Prorocentrum cordatum]
MNLPPNCNRGRSVQVELPGQRLVLPVRQPARRLPALDLKPKGKWLFGPPALAVEDFYRSGETSQAAGAPPSTGYVYSYVPSYVPSRGYDRLDLCALRVLEGAERVPLGPMLNEVDWPGTPVLLRCTAVPGLVAGRGSALPCAGPCTAYILQQGGALAQNGGTLARGRAQQRESQHADAEATHAGLADCKRQLARRSWQLDQLRQETSALKGSQQHRSLVLGGLAEFDRHLQRLEVNAACEPSGSPVPSPVRERAGRQPA